MNAPENSRMRPDPAGKPMTLGELLEWGKKELGFLGEHEAAASAEALLEEVTGLGRSRLYLDSQSVLAENQAEQYQGYVDRRKQRVPVAYITGKACFRDRELEVSPSCLIPRPETEILVEKFLENAGWTENGRGRSFIDTGCGSGAIGISVCDALPEVLGIFSDLSADALRITRRNLEACGLEKRAALVRGDFLECFSGGSCFDAVLSNPPYLSAHDLAGIEPELLMEPRLALDGGADGLDAYRRLCRQAASLLKEDGWLVLELGMGQAETVKGFCLKAGFQSVFIYKDYQQIDRVLMARKHHG